MKITLILTPTPDDPRPWTIRLRLALKYLLRAQRLNFIDYSMAETADESQVQKQKKAAEPDQDSARPATRKPRT